MPPQMDQEERRTDMGYKIKIRGTTYDLKDGFTIKEEFNETLDSGTVQFAIYGQELDKEPFDDVTIFHSEPNVITNKYLEVDSITDDIYSFADDLEDSDHFYTMSLFSETKELERITLPSCSVTQPLTGTKTSVWTMISRFCGMYLPKIKVYDGDSSSGWSYTAIFNIDSAVKTKFENVDCPEFQWDNPTLKEVLNDLMSTLDCIAVVKDHVITYYDLTARGNAIDTSKLSRMTSNFSSADYISELTMFMKNGVGKHLTKSYRYQACRTTDESGEITTNNMSITTQKPIYSIKKLKLYYIPTGQDHLHCVDVASRVLEYDSWRTMSNVTVGSSKYTNLEQWEDANGFSARMHRLNYLYFKRGGNSIENISTSYKMIAGLNTNFLGSVYAPTCELLRSMTEGEKTRLSDVGSRSREIFYEIEYETLYDHAMHFGKNIPNHHPENRVFDNQSNAYVDIQHQSIFEYAKVNRLSNQIKEIYGEYESESEVPLLGDYIGEYILFSKETTYNDNKLLFKGYLTKNYILKDYYTGVMAKKRSWAIASQQEALTRHEIFKYYVEASFDKKKDEVSFITSTYTGHSQYNNSGLIYDLVNVKSLSSDAVASYILDKIRIRTYSSSGRVYHPSSQQAFAMDSDVEILGNSICWTFGFEDNYKAADYMEKEDAMYTQNFYTYTNDDGTFTGITIDVVYDIPDYFTDGSNVSYTLPTPYEDGGNETINSSTRESILESCRSKPLVKRLTISPQSSDEVYGFTISRSFVKDQREIFKATIQFEYCSDTPDIIVKPKFLEYVRAVNADTNKNIHLRVLTSGKYSENETQARGSQAGSAYIGFSVYSDNNNTVYVYQTGYPTGITAWCIEGSDGEILLAVNKNAGVYFNILRSRDDNIYYSVFDRTIVGSIKEGGTANLVANVNERTEEQSSDSEYSSSVELEGSVGGSLSGGGSGRGRSFMKGDTITPVEFQP